jgi:hypothetical protein
MASLLQRSVGTTGGTVQFQPSTATSSFATELSRSLQNTSNEMKAKSDNLYINSFLTDSRKAARDIYNKNSDNPEQLAQELGKYKQGLIGNMPAALRPRLDNEYGSLTEKYLDKATSTKNKLLTVEQNKSLVDNENQIINDMQFAARDLFNNEGLSEDEINTKNITSITQIASDFEAMDKNLGQVGADGNPLRTPDQMAKSVTKAKEFVFSEMATSWLDSQPDKLTAYDKWLNNEVAIDLPEGTINIRDAMTPEVRQKVDKQLIASIKNDLYIDKQQVERVEKAEELFADETKKVLFDQAIDGSLTPATVDASRNILEFNDFKDFSKMAREADPITNGIVYGGFIDKIDQGVDISGELRTERFTNKSISNDDYQKLLDRNKQKGTKAALPSPVDEGRDFLLKFMGSSAEALSILDSQVISKAERDYNGRVQDFIDKEGRNPDRTEALEISDTVKDRWNVIQADSFAVTLPKPRAMPSSMKTKKSELTEENVRKVREDTVKLFKEKWGEDIESMKKDPEFISEIKLLNQYNSIAQGK